MSSSRRWVVWLASPAAALGLAGAAIATTPHLSASRATGGRSVALTTQPIGHAGRWLTDATGRVLVIHGVNVSMKGTPAQSRAYRFGADDAAFLAANGLNAVRLTVERYDVEPTPGHFDATYLSLIRHIVLTLNRYGVLTLIDFHQDEFGPAFHDNGFPTWMTQSGGQPNLYQVGFPYQYLVNPAVGRAFDTLWSNGTDTRGKPLWDDDAELIQRTVTALDHTAGVLGFEIINEPWPGSSYADCLVPLTGCPSFDEGPLSHYYARMDSAVRAADNQHLVFYEPLVTFDYGIPTSVIPPPGDKNLAFAFHDYPLCTFSQNAGSPINFDTECGVESRLAVNNALSQVSSHPDALLNDEFGAAAAPHTIAKSVGLYDEKMVPWMFWSYQEVVGITPAGAYPTPPGRAPIGGVLDVLARPYPQLIAGTPQRWGYDPASRVMTAAYSTSRADGSGRFGTYAISQFGVPARAYPNGYDVSVTGGHVVSGSDSPVLLVAADPDAKRVTVDVTPAAG